MKKRVHEYVDRPRALIPVDAGAFEGRAVPARQWLIPDVLTRGGITMLGGDGGAGKSLLALQLQVACALGAPWLGIPTPRERITSFGFYCEDDEGEIHRRLADICRHYDRTFADLKGRVLFASRVGLANELMVFGTRNDIGELTITFAQLEEVVRAHKVELAIVDTIADAFLGNENIRPQVRAFVQAVRRLSLVNNGGTIITAHPSRAGLSDGSGLSGSTGWNGSVRARLYLSKPKRPDRDVDGEDEPTSERVLKTHKSNYGPSGDLIRLKWSGGVFVRTDIASASLSVYDRLDDDRRLLDAAEHLVRNGERLAASHRHQNSLVNLARDLPLCRDITWKSAAAAQDRLLEKGRLVRVELGPKSRRYLFVRPAHLRYPGEDSGATAGASHEDGADQTHAGAINGEAR